MFSTDVACTALCLCTLLGCKGKADTDATLPSAEPWLNPRALESSSPVVVGPPATEPGIGTPVSLPHYRLTVHSTRPCTIEPYLKPRPGSTVLGVEVQIEGTSQSEVPTNPFYATLVGRNGELYESTLAGCKPALKAVRVTQGKKEQGFISFVVPENQTGFKFQYRPAIIGVADETARIDLSR